MDFKKLFKRPEVITKEEHDRIVHDVMIATRDEERTYWKENNSDMEKWKPIIVKDYKDPFYQQMSESAMYCLPKYKRHSKITLPTRIGAILESVTGGWISLGGGAHLLRRQQDLNSLLLLQDAIFLKVQQDPHARAIVNNIKYYTIGKGTNVACQVPQVAKVIDEFRLLNNMEQREKQMVRTGYMYGEYFVHLIVDSKGNVLLRGIDPSEIEEIETLDDVNTPLSYKRRWVSSTGDSQTVWIPDFNYFEQLKREWRNVSKRVRTTEEKTRKYIQYIKYGEEGETRGRPPMGSTLKYLKYYENFLIDRLRLNHERAKVVWIRTEQGRGKDSYANPFQAPKGGIMLRETEDVRYRIESPKLEAADAKTDGDAVLYMIGAAINMPIHILHQDATTSVYAGIRKSDTPFGQMILDNQDFWGDQWKLLHKFVIHQKVLKGKLREHYRVPHFDQNAIEAVLRIINEAVVDGKDSNDITKDAKKLLKKEKQIKVKTEEIPVLQTFPLMVNDNPLEVAKVLKIHQELGIVSQATLSKRAGYDWNRELQQLLKEKEDGYDQFKTDKKGLTDDRGNPEDRDHDNIPPDLPRS